MNFLERKLFVKQCRLWLFEKLGARLKRIAYDNWLLLYWVSLELASRSLAWAPSFIFFFRMCDNNRGRHYNNKLNDSRWY